MISRENFQYGVKTPPFFKIAVCKEDYDISIPGTWHGNTYGPYIFFVFVADPYEASCLSNSAKSHYPNNTKWRQKARIVPFRDWDRHVQRLSTYSARFFNVIIVWQHLLG
jgi:hypothetical protein